VEQPVVRPEAAVPLYERDRELAALRRHVAAAAAGDGRVAAIEASAGMGKSRLVAEARVLAASSGLLPLGARGGEHAAEFAFGVVRQLFEPHLAALDPDARARCFAGAAALARSLLDAASADALGGARRSAFPTMHGLYWLLANLASESPLLLAVDDVQWADSASLRWLDYPVAAHRRVAGAPAGRGAAARAGA
jgi:hypothetical protein